MKQQRISAEEARALFGAQRPRSKMKNVRCRFDGFVFDSRAEMDFYARTRLDPEVVHIDVHPILTYGPGLRYTADFLVWRRPRGRELSAEPIDVKGRKPRTDFFRLWRTFNAAHPLAPLRVVRRSGRTGSWEVYTDPEQARREW